MVHHAKHVHIAVQPLAKELQKIVYSWKWFTAAKANTCLNRQGIFWQREYFDHLLRHQEGFERTIEYIWANPEAAGLKNWKWKWRAVIRSLHEDRIFLEDW